MRMEGCAAAEGGGDEQSWLPKKGMSVADQIILLSGWVLGEESDP